MGQGTPVQGRPPPPRARRALIGALPALLALLPIACAQPPKGANEPDASQANVTCVERATAPDMLPGTPAGRDSLDYWLARAGDGLDRELLGMREISEYNTATGRKAGDDPFAQRDLLAALDIEKLTSDVAERLDYMRTRIADGSYVGAGGRALTAEQQEVFTESPAFTAPTVHVATAQTPIRCGPHDAPLHKPADLQFDRNACSTIRDQEPVQQLAVWPGGMRLIRTRYAMGWIGPGAALTPALDAERATAIVQAPRLRSERDGSVEVSGRTRKVARHTLLPVAKSGQSVWVATPAGVAEVRPPAGLVPTRRAMTRRALLSTAFQYMDSPYGFGGQGGGRDCSRFLLDLFESFDVALPRHSGWQAQAGSHRIDLDPSTPDADKLAAIDRAHEHGVVLLYFPGHIMLYLGRDEDGTPMALHSLGEYARPCGGSKVGSTHFRETVFHVGKMVVSDLELGRGSSRTAFIERVTRLVIFGGPAPPPVGGRTEAPAAEPITQRPEPAACSHDVDRRIFVSPRRPAMGDSMKLIATATKDPGPVALSIWDPDGERVQHEDRHLGGPPFTTWAQVGASKSGFYTVALGNGDEVVACKRLAVRRHAVEHTPGQVGQPTWQPAWKWERDTENLWSAFVEQLFDYPADDGRTWTNLHTLLRDRDRNLVHGHLRLGEDEAIELVPDCADLPYVLRAYFAWKLRLPFAYRRCSRGKPGRPPSCGAPNTNLWPRELSGDIQAFHQFVNRKVRSGVHSASGRTHPRSDATDYYPVELSRAALAPGTVYADPYGHVMLVSRWYPQGRSGSTDYGILMASEAQPDGTIGRRRFWRGSFLFDPSTDDAGAGFKRFRPLVFDGERGEVVAIDNAELRASREHTPFDMAQYEGSRDDFYRQMDVLINPKPLDAQLRLVSLVDALEESVKRRVIAIDNGEQHMASVAFRTMTMPTGYSIFETEGPWEDFSTPSRDMRLLISIDTVTAFPQRVGDAPERYGRGNDGAAARSDMEKRLSKLLSERSFIYTRSDGSSQALTLSDVVARSPSLEMAYNPNDCIEIRWAAAQDGAEYATCKRHAPETHRALMRKYRPWFSERTRPPRGTR